jgi:hypothetical protein
VVPSAKNSVFFGNPKYFIQRRVPRSMYVRRFWQNPFLGQCGLVGFEGWLRADRGLVALRALYATYHLDTAHS